MCCGGGMPTMGFEEQEDEIEALGAIFPEEFTLLDKPPALRWSLRLIPDAEEVHVGVDLVCKPGEAYPYSVPEELSLREPKGLSRNQLDALTALAAETAEMNVGMASGFVVAEAIREWLLENNTPIDELSMHADMLRRIEVRSMDKCDGEENIGGGDDVGEDEEEKLRLQRAEGTPVTCETFTTWWTAFQSEMAAAKQADGKIERECVNENSSKLTGLEMFQQHLVGTEEAAEEELLEVGDESIFLRDDGDLESLPSDSDNEEENA